ncbi:hypothetical protein PG997_014206 [Apiospora hydei]|uniref:Apple domain-containing protein n=1 Tax=Apiospora hydei TaxID=1337664 RepID=A0ABR1UT47_9PEZI
MGTDTATVTDTETDTATATSETRSTTTIDATATESATLTVTKTEPVTALGTTTVVSTSTIYKTALESTTVVANLPVTPTGHHDRHSQPPNECEQLPNPYDLGFEQYSLFCNQSFQTFQSALPMPMPETSFASCVALCNMVPGCTAVNYFGFLGQCNLLAAAGSLAPAGGGSYAALLNQAA